MIRGDVNSLCMQWRHDLDLCNEINLHLCQKKTKKTKKRKKKRHDVEKPNSLFLYWASAWATLLKYVSSVCLISPSFRVNIHMFVHLYLLPLGIIIFLFLNQYFKIKNKKFSCTWTSIVPLVASHLLFILITLSITTFFLILESHFYNFILIFQRFFFLFL